MENRDLMFNSFPCKLWGPIYMMGKWETPWEEEQE